MEESSIIEHTKNWLRDVVIGCNFCPFAGREFKRETIHYTVVQNSDREKILQTLALQLERLNDYPAIETTLIIIPENFEDFYSYLDLVSLSEMLIEREGYEGIYQVASFHPNYLFAGSSENDASNYTNRSPYPMLHLLREESISKALESYSHPEAIPERNIEFANRKGLQYMQALRQACLRALE